MITSELVGVQCIQFIRLPPPSGEQRAAAAAALMSVYQSSSNTTRSMRKVNKNKCVCLHPENEPVSLWVRKGNRGDANDSVVRRPLKLTSVS